MKQPFSWGLETCHNHSDRGRKRKFPLSLQVINATDYGRTSRHHPLSRCLALPSVGTHDGTPTRVWMAGSVTSSVNRKYQQRNRVTTANVLKVSSKINNRKKPRYFSLKLPVDRTKHRSRGGYDEMEGKCAGGWEGALIEQSFWWHSLRLAAFSVY